MKTVMIYFGVLSFVSIAYAERLMILPFEQGYISLCTQGAGGTTSHAVPGTQYDLDFDTPNNQDISVVACVSGHAYVHYDGGGFGNHVNIAVGTNEFYVIAHLKSISVQNGQYVTQGQIIGVEGCTGNCDGDHVHVGRHTGDPTKNANQSVSIRATRIWTRDVTANGMFRELTSEEFIGGLVSGHLYEAGHIIGHWKSGEKHQNIWDCYQRFAGTSDDPGDPTDNTGGTLDDGLYVHRWYSTNGLASVVIQDFYNTGTDKHYAIVNSESVGKAFLLKEGFRWLYLGNANAPYEYGEPISDEVENWTDTAGRFGVTGKVYNAIQLFDLVAMLWDGATLEIKPRNGFTIAIIPGDGQNLDVVTYAQSAHAIYITYNAITGANRYAIMLNGSVVVETTTLEYTAIDLTPDTDYLVQVAALDASGDQITASVPETVHTQVEIDDTRSEIGLSLSADSLNIYITWATFPEVSFAVLMLDGVVYDSTSNNPYTIYNAGAGSHIVRVELYAPTGELVGADAEGVTVGQNIVVSSVGPSVMGPNESGEVRFTFRNSYDVPATFTFRWTGSSDPFAVTAFSEFPDPGILPAHGVVEVVVPFITQDYFLWASHFSIAIAAELSGSFPTASLLNRNKQHKVFIIPFVDYRPQLIVGPEVIDEGRMGFVTVQVNNDGNSTAVPTPLELYVNDQLVTSVLTPELAARQWWQQELPIGQYEPGVYDLDIVVDPDGVVIESVEDNNSVVTSFEVVGVPKPDVRIDVALGSTFQVGDIATGSGLIYNDGDADSGPCQYRITDGVTVIDGLIDAVAPGASRPFAFSFPLNQVGDITITAVVDPDNTITERDELNNQFIAMVTVLPILPDLQVQSTTYTGSSRSGKVTYQVSIKNAGTKPSGSFKVTVTIPEISKVITKSFKSISPSLVKAQSFSFTTSYRGPLTFQVTVDSRSQVFETNETNNYFEEQKML